jgi:peptide deformylase
MAILEIKQAGDKILKEKAQRVGKIDKRIKQLLDNMAETMYEADGVGLAAPQVGVSLRVIVIDIGEGLVELINPQILEQEGEATALEGCLSVPGIYGEVKRSSKVTVECVNSHGKKVKYIGEGLLGRALQHEIDHLEGVLFIDKAESIMTSKLGEQRE